MTETITVRDAGPYFTRLLSEVAEGHEFTVSRDGVPVARIVPQRAPAGRALTAEQENAWADTLAWMRRPKPEALTPFATRDALYDDMLDERRPG